MDLATVTLAAAGMMAAGGLEALGSSAGQSAFTALSQRVAGIRARFMGTGAPAQELLAAADRRPDDAATIRDLAAALASLAARDATFRRDLEEVGHEADRIAPGGVIQIAEKISNVSNVSVARDLNINL